MDLRWADLSDSVIETSLHWTSNQILALAGDAATVSAARGLLSPRKWSSLGGDDRALWGECQGSGAKPYQVQVDLVEPAFRCTCPSRKFPCKHSLALFLLAAEDAAAMSSADRPAWVAEWLEKRDAKSQPAAKTGAPPDADALARGQAAQEKRATTREARVAAGIEELDLWMRDLVRGGLSAAQSRPGRYWEDVAARMVDAQAPGLARRMREMATIPASGEGWPSRLLEHIARVHLLLEAYRRLAGQPAPLQASIRTHLGWTIKQEELLQQEGIRAEWLVVGRVVTEEDRLLVQRTWLLCPEMPGGALLLNFAPKGQPLDVTLVPGACLDAELVTFPGAVRQRAAVKSVYRDLPSIKQVPCVRSSDALLTQYAEDLASDPWLERRLACLAGVTPALVDGRWAVVDADGSILPVVPNFAKAWELFSLGGGNPVTLFGEWDGHALYPLSVVADGRFVDLTA